MEVLNAVVVLCNLLVAEVVFQAKSQQGSTERDTLISRDGDIHWPANQLKQRSSLSNQDRGGGRQRTVGYLV